MALVPALLAGCASGASQGSGSFLGRASNAVVFIQWTRTGHSLSGSLQETILRQPAGSGIQAQQTGFTGSISGNGLTLQLAQQLGSTTALVGRLTRAGFTLTFPGKTAPLTTIGFVPAQIAAYNGAVHAIDVSQYSSPCTLYVQDHDATLTITGPHAASDCASFVANVPTDGTWTTEPQQPVGELGRVCQLASGADEATVNDSGGQHYGQEACSTFAQEGWSEPAGTATAPTGVAPVNTGTGATTTSPLSQHAGRTVRVVRCPTSFGVTPTSTSTPTQISTPGVSGSTANLAAYTNTEEFLIAPAGMQCSGAVGADGNGEIIVWPKGQSKPKQHSPGAGLTLTVIPACVGCMAQAACPFFPAFAHSRASYLPCGHVPRGESLDRLGPDAVAFEDPAGLAGDGWPSGGSYPANGVVDIKGGSGPVYRATCTLPPSQHAICTTSLNDVLDQPG